MNTQHNGSILITTLLFLLMMTTSTLLSMSSSILQLRLSRYETLDDALYNAAENGLMAILNNQQDACMQPSNHPDFYAQQPAAWWLSETCSIQNTMFQVRYVIEFLKTLDCQRIQNIPHLPNTSVDLNRVTLWVQGEEQIKILQSNIISKRATPSTCLESKGTVKLGIQTQRLF